MKTHLKIISTMLAIVAGLSLYFWLLSTYPNIVLGFFAVVFALIGLVIFYAGVASFFPEENE